MRILIVVHGYPPTQNGGAERRAKRTALGMAARGHTVRVLSGALPVAPAPPGWFDHIQDGIGVRFLTQDLSSGTHAFRQSYDNAFVAAALIDLFMQELPDVVHLFSGYLMSASVMQVAHSYGVPVVVSLTDYWWLCHRINLIRTDGTRCSGPSHAGCAWCLATTLRRYRLLAHIWPGLSRRVWQYSATLPLLARLAGLPAQRQRTQTLVQSLHVASMLIAPSAYLAHFYMRHGIASEKIRIWRQGVQLTCCPLRTNDPALRVGYIGQIKHHKGVHLLLEAWSRLHGERLRRLVLYGSPAGEDAYGKMIQQQVDNHSTVHWEGQFQGEAVWNVLASLDILVVPSRWVENSPNAILEAQAMGVPVIGADLGGIAELIQHEQNGLLFEVDQPDDLARQLQRVLDDPDLLSFLRANALPFHPLEAELNQLENLYYELMGQ